MTGKYILKYTTALIATSLLSNPCYSAAQNPFPKGCRAVGYQFSQAQVQLKQEDPSIPRSQTISMYMIKNTLNVPIVMQNANSNRFLPSYKKTIPAHHWAAFSRSDRQISLSCEAQHSATDCEQAINICNYNHAKYPTQNLGTYWLQKTTSQLQELLNVIIRKGILLRW